MFVVVGESEVASNGCHGGSCVKHVPRQGVRRAGSERLPESLAFVGWEVGLAQGLLDVPAEVLAIFFVDEEAISKCGERSSDKPDARIAFNLSLGSRPSWFRHG